METPRRCILRNQHLENIQANKCTPIKIPASPFLKTLGYGTGVNVYRLDRSPKCGQIRSPWAVKRITQRTRVNGIELFNERILEEANVLRKLNHPNIVGFRGMVKTNDGVDSLALECCTTSLGSILEDRSDNELGPLPAKNTTKMILDISHALDYLHTEAKLLHGDLKSFNVLVKGDFEICKLCDFGVSLPLDENGEINLINNPKLNYVGTNLWSAPEVIDELEIFDSKADIFSFGLVVYETLALSPPHMLPIDDVYNKAETETTSSLVDEKENVSSFIETDSDSDLFDQLEPALGTRPLLPVAFELSDEYNRIVEIFYCCTNNLSEDRPSAKTIWQSFEQDLKKTETTETEDKNVTQNEIEVDTTLDRSDDMKM